VSTPLPNNQSTTPKRSRAEQARINGAKSKGPVSDAGRARSQRAKLQHGRYARSEATSASFLLKNEDPTQFDLFRRGWLALLGPQSDAETEFLDGFIANEWRLIRFQAAETGLINDEMRRNRPKVDPGIQHLSPADREQSRLAQAVSGLYEKSPAANALDRKINQLQRARLSSLQAWAILRAQINPKLPRHQPEPDFPHEQEAPDPAPASQRPYLVPAKPAPATNSSEPESNNAGRTQELLDSKPLPRSVHPNPVPGETQGNPTEPQTAASPAQPVTATPEVTEAKRPPASAHPAPNPGQKKNSPASYPSQAAAASPPSEMSHPAKTRNRRTTQEYKNHATD
jgi:hypothetical protein